MSRWRLPAANVLPVAASLRRSELPPASDRPLQSDPRASVRAHAHSRHAVSSSRAPKPRRLPHSAVVHKPRGPRAQAREANVLSAASWDRRCSSASRVHDVKWLLHASVAASKARTQSVWACTARASKGRCHPLTIPAAAASAARKVAKPDTPHAVVVVMLRSWTCATFSVVATHATTGQASPAATPKLRSKAGVAAVERADATKHTLSKRRARDRALVVATRVDGTHDTIGPVSPAVTPRRRSKDGVVAVADAAMLPMERRPLEQVAATHDTTGQASPAATPKLHSKVGEVVDAVAAIRSVTERPTGATHEVIGRAIHAVTRSRPKRAGATVTFVRLTVDVIVATTRAPITGCTTNPGLLPRTRHAPS